MSCKKKPYESPFKAGMAAMSMRRWGKAHGKSKGTRMGVYYCKECRSYHFTSHYQGKF